MVTNSYLWRDGALIDLVSNRPNTAQSTVYTSDYVYNRRNDLTSVVIADGRPRRVDYVTDLGGQIIVRDETITATPTGPAPF